MEDLEAEWQLAASRLIFVERHAAALPIQTCYRRHRALRRFIQAAESQPYLSESISDLPLAAHRPGLAFRLPRTTRDARRVVWAHCTRIQTAWRTHIARRRYLDKLLRVRTVQSFGRMTPAKVRFRLMRVAAVRLQAWARAAVTRRLFLRLRRAAVIVQKTLRGYFSVLRRCQLQDRLWREMESRVQATRVLQNAVREYLARKRVKAIRLLIQKREHAALLLQRQWYKRNGFFHTFLLMSCYRELEREEADFGKLIGLRGRHVCARRIQRFYRIHRFNRVLTAAVTLQKWYRGRMGYLRTKLLRRRKYAARMLRHWARAKIDFRHRMARRIQRRWWLCGYGRLLRHLDFTARRMDREVAELSNRERYTAAARLQSWLRMLSQRWRYRLICCAKCIQRSYRSFRAKMQWMQLRNSVRSIFAKDVVGNIIVKATASIVHGRIQTMQELVVSLQAQIRGWLARRAKLLREQAMLHRMRCMIRLQTFWKKHLVSIKRSIFNFRNGNRYGSVTHIRDLVIALNRDTRRHISIFDPRIGMTITTLLSRLGLEQYAEMFPKQLSLVSDLTRFDVQDYKDLYDGWQARIEREAATRGININKGSKRLSIPKDVLESIFNVTSLKIYPSSKTQQQTLISIAPIVEIMSSAELIQFIKSEFMRKFGTSFSTKASNIAYSIAEELYGSYSNYSSLGSVLTMANITRTIASANTSNKIKPLLAARISAAYDSAQELQRNIQRCKLCSATLEDGCERAIQLLDAGCLLSRVFDASKSVVYFKRRFNFLYKSYSYFKLSKSRNDSVLSSGLCIPNRIPRESQRLDSIIDNTKKLYTGGADYRELEFDVCISKIMLSALEPLYVANKGFQLLQCIFRFHIFKKITKRGRLHLFLNSEMVRYIRYRRKNLVQSKWSMLRRIEGIALSMQDILLEKLQLRQEKIIQLSIIPRFGWKSYVDERGAVYWNNCVDSIFEAPLYSLAQWKSAEKIQSAYRRHLLLIKLKKAQQLQEYERLIAKERLKSQRYTINLVKLDIDLRSEPYSYANKELFLPWHLRFDQDFHLRPHVWLLMKSMDGLETFQVVLILRVKRSKSLEYCDVRTVQDVIIVDVPSSSIFKLNLSIGSAIEARYKGSVSFYPGKIMSLNRSRSGVEYFNILYDDGEFERRVPSVLIRMPQSEVDRLILLRDHYFKRLSMRERRLMHYTGLGADQRDRSIYLKTKIVFSQRALRYGWHYRKEKGKVLYYNPHERIKSWKAKEYSPEESASAIRIQSLCRMHICRERLKRILSKFTPESITHSAIEDGKKIAFIGYKLEGGEFSMKYCLRNYDSNS